MFRETFTTAIRQVQDDLCQKAVAIDGTAFHEDVWQRPEGGGGRTRVLANGKVFEKAGINFSEVHGILPQNLDNSTVTGTKREQGRYFWAAGISLVIHPLNPYAPTAHANFRYFETGDSPEQPTSWWFGGGADLTPHFLFEEDATHFHRVWRDACNRHDPEYYPRFKKSCDEYFFLPHRGETRGIGGIIFDDLRDKPRDLLFAFVHDCASSFAEAYFPIVERRWRQPYGETERQWQKLRRGRYVEFNLVYDRGTTFGLKTGGRTESILMSLPPEVSFHYHHEVGDPALMAALRTPREWV